MSLHKLQMLAVVLCQGRQHLIAVHARTCAIATAGQQLRAVGSEGARASGAVHLEGADHL